MDLTIRGKYKIETVCVHQFWNGDENGYSNGGGTTLGMVIL